MNDVWQAIQMNLGSLTWSRILTVLALLIVCLLASKLLRNVFDKALSRMKVDKTLQGFLSSCIKFLLYFVTVLIVASSLGIPVTSLVALLSVLGLAVSLAVQDALSNLAGSLTLLSVKPFQVDDFVEAAGVSGTVTKIGLIYTTLKTADNKLIYLPNSKITTGQVINYSSMPNRRIELLISASYEATTEDVKQALLTAAAQQPEVLSDPAPFASIQQYDDSAITYLLRVWVPTDIYWDVYYRLTEAVRVAFAHAQIDMTYPHVNVHMLDH